MHRAQQVTLWAAAVIAAVLSVGAVATPSSAEPPSPGGSQATPAAGPFDPEPDPGSQQPPDQPTGGVDEPAPDVSQGDPGQPPSDPPTADPEQVPPPPDDATEAPDPQPSA